MTRMFTGVALALLACLSTLPALADGAARDALFNAYQKMVSAHYVADTVTIDGKGRKSNSTLEFETMNRFRATTGDTAMVVLPEGVWMRSGNGEWMQPPIDMSAMFKGMLPMAMDEVRSGTTNVKDEGMRTINGQDLRAISYDVDSKVMGISVSSHNTVFLDDSGKIVRSESDSTVMKQTSHTVQTLRYDDSIRVTAPR
ncbi:hypothetical protein [Dokdonella sp.]|uniref:hypothetical protein n=1 Tax=Dokdonella sp. TaxID=2291710 RepID=UPI003C77D584